MRNMLSCSIALMLGLLAVAPPILYTIPIMVNSLFWCYLVSAAAFLAFWMCRQRDLHIALKVMTVYLLANCFLSEVPYLSFNAFIVYVPTIALFILMVKYGNERPVIAAAEAAFWVNLMFAFMSYTGNQTLINFGVKEPVFFGTILQHMRFASLLCILSPFLLMRSKLYILPIAGAAVLCHSSGFALAILAGVLVYLALKRPPKWLISLSFATVLPFLGAAVWLGRDSWLVAMREGRIPIWMVVIKSWIFDTKVAIGPPDWFGISQTGPFNPQALFFGHGLETFRGLFHVYKHDYGAWAEAHNCWIQLPWELGLVGVLILAAYLIHLVKRLLEADRHDLLAGLAIIGTNMIFHFPTRMTQTQWWIVAYLAICEMMLRRGTTRRIYG